VQSSCAAGCRAHRLPVLCSPDGGTRSLPDGTDRAVARIKVIVAATPGGLGLRLAVNGGGCSGFQYDFSIAEAVSDDDLVLEQGGAKVLLDPMSQPFLAGAELDFADDLIGQSFKVNNPNATASCGCGTSFSI
jgi:iron-sulfur cluster insertion protein